MRGSFVLAALLANALASGLVLLLLLNDGGWGAAPQLSVTQAQLLVAVAAVAFVLNLLLAPVIGISFWAGARETRRLEAELDAARRAPPRDEPPA